MTSSVRKKKEKAKDFQKTKLKVGKTRPKNTNATDTSFSAKAITLKQQSLSDTSRSPATFFSHNLSLLSSKSETQRKDALIALISVLSDLRDAPIPQPAAIVLGKAQPLILDGNKAVRDSLVKLLRHLPTEQLGSLDQLLLYIRAGMTHLSAEIRATALDVLDWAVDQNPLAVMSCPGSWIKTLRTFQNLFAWTTAHGNPSVTKSGTWTATRSPLNLGNSKLVVRQLMSLAFFLTCGLSRSLHDSSAESRRFAVEFPFSQMGVHTVPRKSRPFAYLNLFGTVRDVESEVYETSDERAEVFTAIGLNTCFAVGVAEFKKEGGEIGRAAAAVIKALGLANPG